MSTFWMISSLGILELTSTESVQISKSSSITQHKMESGSDAADNVVNENMVISFNGLVSDIKRITFGSNTAGQRVIVGSQGSFQKNVQDYVNLLDEIRNSRERFSLLYDTRFPAAEDCLLQNVVLQRDKDTGTGYKVSIDIQQVRISEQARQVESKPQLKPNDTAGQSSTSNNTTISQTQPPTKSILASTGEGVYSLVTESLSGTNN